MRFEFATASKILFGPGVLQDAGQAAAVLSSKALVVHGHTAEPVQRLQNILAKAGVESITFQITGEPDIDQVCTAVSAIQASGPGLVIGIGGGSSLDTAKAAAALAPQAGEVLDYLEVIGTGRALDNPPLPFIAIPTTAGTGSEVTRNAVLASRSHAVKTSLRSPQMLARLAIVDPDLMTSMPPGVTAATGLDAITQLVEPYVSRKANPATDAFCTAGLAQAGKWFLEAYEHGGNLQAREGMALAALFSGLALANSGLGADHGLAAPLGGNLGAPHGALCARLLGPVVEINLAAMASRDPHNPAVERYSHICEILVAGEKPSGIVLARWIQELTERVKIPRLREYGLRTAQFEEVVRQAQKASSMKGNPVVLEDGEVYKILEMAY